MRNLLMLFTLTLFLCGCGAKVDDLVTFTAQVKQDTQVSIEAYPKFNELAAVEYAANTLRSPFAQSKLDIEKETNLVVNSNCLQPQHNRPKSALESYGIDALQMAGVISIEGKRYALIKANDGSLHQVKRGQYLGLFNGKVISVSHQQIQIQELLPDGAGCWKTKQATLTMSSMTGERDNV